MENQQELTVLLIEDDENACDEIRDYVDRVDDIKLVAVTNDATKALELVKYHMPDAIILDLELHMGGGNGIFFLSKQNEVKVFYFL